MRAWERKSVTPLLPDRQVRLSALSVAVLPSGLD